MDFFENLTPTATLVLISAVIIIVITLFSRFLKLVLKLAIIGVMMLFILYFLRQAGII